MRQAEADQGLRDAPSSQEREEIKALKRENYEKLLHEPWVVSPDG